MRQFTLFCGANVQLVSHCWGC